MSRPTKPRRSRPSSRGRQISKGGTLSLATLILGAAAFAAAELAITLLPGRFFAWGRAEALLFLAFRPWLLLVAATLVIRFDPRSRLSFYTLAIALATACEAIFLLSLGASDPWPQLLRGVAAAAALLLVLDLTLALFRRLFGRRGPLLGAVALAILFLTPIGLRGYEALILAGDSRGEAVEKPNLMLMTALPIIWGEGGAFDPESRPAHSYRMLQREFAVRPLDVLSRESLGQGRLLLLAQPRALAPMELVALDAWVRAGGRVLILADPRLDWPSDLPLGDMRRPPPVSYLGPLLSHWGVALEARSRQGPAITEHAVPGESMRLVMTAPGRFEAPDCRRPLPDGFLMECNVGEGEAMLVADADLLRDELWAPLGAERHQRTADNPLVVAEWLDRLAGIERPRATGPVQWLDPDAVRIRAVLLALLTILAALGATLLIRNRRPAA